MIRSTCSSTRSSGADQKHVTWEDVISRQPFASFPFYVNLDHNKLFGFLKQISK